MSKWTRLGAAAAALAVTCASVAVAQTPGAPENDNYLQSLRLNDPGDRLDGWYDALLATISASAPDVATAARGAKSLLADLPETGVPHDGPDVCAVLDRLARGRPAQLR